MTDEITKTDYIAWFTSNHAIQDLDSKIDGVIIADIGTDYLILKDKVKQ
jgi:hypothetical protein